VVASFCKFSNFRSWICYWETVVPSLGWLFVLYAW
jgi:hypothetical protein